MGLKSRLLALKTQWTQAKGDPARQAMIQRQILPVVAQVKSMIQGGSEGQTQQRTVEGGGVQAPPAGGGGESQPLGSKSGQSTPSG